MPTWPATRGSTIGTTIGGIRKQFESYGLVATTALGRVGDEAFFMEPGPGMNSLAVLVKHMGGNLRSRWTEFLTTDGEKPDRNRDGEFVIGPDDARAELMRRWARGWRLVLETLDGLDDSDLARTVRIRGQSLTVRAALLRQLTHAAYHVGQIVLLARLYTEEWDSLSIPPGQSEEYTAGLKKEADR